LDSLPCGSPQIGRANLPYAELGEWDSPNAGFSEPIQYNLRSAFIFGSALLVPGVNTIAAQVLLSVHCSG
jgi:hypothetical protein